MIIQVEHANQNDLNDLVQLFQGYRIFYEQEPDADAERAFIQARIENHDAVIFIARDGESRAALGFTQLYPLFSSVSMKPLWLLNDLYVAEAGRKRGVGEALMQRAENHARETRTKGLVLNTAHTNITAQRLYERMGYTKDEIFRTYQRFF
jgi:ribosomal protein S18 acetylase RimI-like enzyme